MFVAVITLVIAFAATIYLKIMEHRYEKERDQHQRERLIESAREEGRKSLERKNFKKNLAKADIARMTAQKDTIVKLMDSIEQERAESRDTHKRTTLLGKQVAAEAKIHTLDRKIEMAYHAINI